MQISNLSSSLLATLHQGNQINQSRQIAMTRLATGNRINPGADDPAGLISSEHLRSAIAVLEAESNALQRTSHVADTADAALGEMSDQLIDARAANVALANSAGLTSGERDALQMQVNYAVQSVDRIARQSNFAGTPLLDGNLTLHAGGDSLTLDQSHAGALGEVTQGSQTADLADVGSNVLKDDRAFTESIIDTAFNQLVTRRAEVGAFNKYSVQSRNNALQVELENTVAAESQIRDTDYAKEVSNLVSSNIKGQANIKALQINSLMQKRVLDLLG
ncbi:MAG: hypothetical protein JKX85_08735 [Phycisphaeraceae bacterium]|nr:hypothetical protein [Phycisphaeraceae bacterium]